MHCRSQAENNAKIHALWKYGAFAVLLNVIDKMNILSVDPETEKLGVTPQGTSLLLHRAVLALSNMLLYAPPGYQVHEEQTIILRTMEKYMDCDAELHYEAIRFLSIAKSRNKDFSAKVGVSGAKTVLRSVTVHAQDEPTQKMGFVVLADLASAKYSAASADHNAAAYLAQDTCLRTLVNNTIMWIDSVAVQGAAMEMFHMISKYTVTLDSKMAMVHAGCVDAIVKSMRIHTDARESVVQRAGCHALFCITELFLPCELRTRMLEEGAADTALQSVVKNMNDDADIVMNACCFLHNLLMQHPSNVGVAGKKIMPVLIKVTGTPKYANDWFVHNSAGSTLLNILTHAGSISSAHLVAAQNDFAMHAGVHAATTCLNSCARNHLPVCAPGAVGNWADVAQRCLHNIKIAVRNHKKNQVLCASEGVSASIIRLLAKPVFNHLVLDGCIVLSYMIDGNKAAAEMLVKQGAVPMFAKGARMAADPVRLGLLQNIIDTLAPGYDDSQAHLWSGQNSRESDHMAGSKQAMPKTAGASSNSDQSDRSGDVAAFVAANEKSKKASAGGQKLRKAEGCSKCGTTPADLGVEKLLKCSGCTIAPLYCSVVCQQACWKAHKADCKANKKKNV
jgi:hypothetical protein